MNWLCRLGMHRWVPLSGQWTELQNLTPHAPRRWGWVWVDECKRCGARKAP